MKKLRFASFFLALLLTLSVFGVHASADSAASGDSETGIRVQAAEPTTQPVQPEEGFVCDKLTDPNSESIFMVSLDTGTVVFTMNPDERRPMASLTKIMTYIVTAETVDDLQNTRTTVPESVAQELEGTGSSLAEIQTGEEFSIYELLNLMMVPSGNDAALTLAKYVDSLGIPAEDAAFDEDGDGKMSFVELMNRKAQELGCTNTHFVNPHGLYDENHYTTAREMAVITQYALTLPYFAEITSQTFYTQAPTNKTSEARTVTTSNRMLLSYAEEYYTYATGIKTGSLNESGYCIAASGLYDGYSYLVICMGSPYIDANGNRTNYHGEMYDAATLLRWAFLNIETKTLVADGDLLGEVELKYAWDKDRLQVVAEGNVTAMLPTNLEEDSITVQLELPDSVKAPIKKGDQVGTATYIYKGEVLAEVPLVAAESVERSEIIQTIEQGKEILTSPWFLLTAAVILVLAIAYVVLAVLINRKRRRMRRVKKYRDM
ncbi:MAG: D-alanyl-D-alanine carboxypeptidase family protein [Hominenteromicrobium sp.]